ncbi:protein TolQ [Erythrobacter litoralis]|uniref:TolQ, tolQ protein n=1 Tax=Erythrobacter litoralis (strain HTCC2594) TaxID=314225 RepID=Q2N8J3_ERYLH|nr:protein TolQ [Erythrobacter litoralis]ABC63998.1 TolQ, tolQ protein [Erythrobacter litoralis HTCC2594]
MSAFPVTMATGEATGRLDPLQLFLDADIVVQAVMIGLILASIWSWMIIVSFSMRLSGARSRSARFEKDLWQADDFDSIMGKYQNKDVPSARIAGVAMTEWKRSTSKGLKDREAASNRIAAAMGGQVAEEADTLAARLNFLATTGSVAPFVGLFGTVWGIMNSFFQIGVQESSSLAVVAPGISEALFATAIGLFAAIPAVIAYNRFSSKVNIFEARLQRFADKFHANLSRELERL